MNAINQSKRALSDEIALLVSRAEIAKDDIAYYAQRDSDAARAFAQCARDSYVRTCEMIARKRAVYEAFFCVQMLISAGLMSD